MIVKSISYRFEYSFPPLIGAKAERTQSEGRANPEWRQSVYYIIPKKPKIRVPLLRKKSGTTLQKASAKKVHFLCRANATSRSKVAPDDNDNNNNNRDETLFHTPVHSLQGKRNDRQLHTPKCELWTVKCNVFWFFESMIWHSRCNQITINDLCDKLPMLQKNKGNSHFTLFAGLYDPFCHKRTNNRCRDFTFYILHAMCFWTRIARIWRIFIRVIRVIRVRITMIIRWTRIARIWRIFIRVIRAIRVQK